MQKNGPEVGKIGKRNLTMQIGSRFIGDGQPCFVVAELSCNHFQSYARAEELVRLAKEAGADAVKLQTFTPDTITMDSHNPLFLVGGQGNPDSWKKKSLYELYQTAYMPWEWQPKLKKLADELGIILFSSAFDTTAVDFLEKMEVPCYKIASYEATDWTILTRVAKTGKPVIISVGYTTLDEVAESVEVLKKNGAREIAILHCVTGYAGDPDLSAMNLRTIRDISDHFGVVAGFSDNNAGIEVPVLAVEAGASIVEKHFTIRRADGGLDERFSIEPEEFAEMVKRIRRGECALGRAHYGPANDLERENIRFRRSLFAVRDVKKGERFTPENVRSIRPADGLPTKWYPKVIGATASRDIEAGTPLQLDLIIEQKK